MKTKITISTVVMAISLIAMAQDSKADNTNLILKDNEPSLEMKQEKNVNDIPFNTEKIFQKYLYHQAMTKEYKLRDEKNVDDIPFDTWKIFINNQMTLFKLKDEKNVNDIEFNTGLIVTNYLIDQMAFKLPDEPNVDDLPFNTSCIAFSNPEYWRALYRLEWEECTYLFDYRCTDENIHMTLPAIQLEMMPEYSKWYINWDNRKLILHNYKRQHEISRTGILKRK